MEKDLIVRKAVQEDAGQIVSMVESLLSEIVLKTGVQSFNFNTQEAVENLLTFFQEDKYIVFLAEVDGKAVGFIALTESYALYAEGVFGTITEFFV